MHIYAENTFVISMPRLETLLSPLLRMASLETLGRRICVHACMGYAAM